MTAAAIENPRHRTWAFTLLCALALIVALRLSLTETLRETLAQKQNHLLARIDPSKYIDLPFVGPAATTAFAGLTLLITAGAAALASAAGVLTAPRLARWLLITAVGVLGLFSAFAAANKFAAIVGLADLLTAVSAGWSVSLLCHPRLAGPRGRRLLIALFAAILATWIAKGLLQRFVDQPDTLAAFIKDRDEILRGQGIAPDSPSAVAYENRLRSAEVTGFLTLANVTAAALVGLLTLLTGTLAALLSANLRRDKAAAGESTSGDVPGWALYSVAAAILLVLGLWMLRLTYSNGGAAMGVLCCAAVAGGIALRRHVARFRRALIVLTCVVFAGGLLAVVAYGLHFDRLPSKSLLFRWYYWSAAVPLVQQHPMLGVGLDNFGSYYTQFKRPAAPEDVIDPHSFFVRLAAELGLPATLLIALLLVWTALSAVRPAPELPAPAGAPPNSANTLIAGTAFALSWWLLQYAIAGPYDVYFLSLAIINALIASAGGVSTFLILESWLPAERLRAITLAGVIGALGMLAYDQINMALVTGPVAMLFWMLLHLADADYPPAARRQPLGYSLAMIPAVAGLATLVLLAIPILRGTMPWDAAPFEYRFLQAMNTSDPRTAEAAVDDALARSPRAMDLLRERIALRQRLHEPIADDLRRAFSLDRANARIRVVYALPPSDLPDAERARALREALAFDAALAPDEPKRLSPEERQRVEEALRALDPQGQRPPQ
jgi:hypothetical protein